MIVNPVESKLVDNRKSYRNRRTLVARKEVAPRAVNAGAVAGNLATEGTSMRDRSTTPAPASVGRIL